MDILNIILVVLSVISFLFSILAFCATKMALKTTTRVKAKAKALEMSRVEVPLEEIMGQLRALPQEHGDIVLMVHAKRVSKDVPSKGKHWLVALNEQI